MPDPSGMCSQIGHSAFTVFSSASFTHGGIARGFPLPNNETLSIFSSKHSTETLTSRKPKHPGDFLSVFELVFHINLMINVTYTTNKVMTLFSNSAARKRARGEVKVAHK